MCSHKSKLNANDKRFLRSLRIEAFNCAQCEGKSRPGKELPLPKIRTEEPSHDDNEAHN